MAENTLTDTQQALQLLTQVLNLLLDPKKNVVDDTSLQRLARYCAELFCREEISNHRDEFGHVIRFLETCSTADLSACDPCTMTFALRLVKCLSSSQELLDHIIVKCNETVQTSDIDQGLLVRLLQRALHDDMSTERSVKVAWLRALTAVCHSKNAIAVYQHTGAFAVALNFLEDSSMFVVSTAQRFLAMVLVSQYAEKRVRREKSSTSGFPNPNEASQKADNVTCSAIQGNITTGESYEKNLTGDQKPEIGKRLVTEEELADSNSYILGGGVNLHGQKRAKLSDKMTAGCSGSDTEHVSTICENLMACGDTAMLLARLLSDLQPNTLASRPLFSLVDGTQRHDTKMIASLGVFQSLLNKKTGSSSSGLALLDDVAMVTRCRKILYESKVLFTAVCDAVVYLLVCILDHKGPTCTTAEGEHLLSAAQSLPAELIMKGHIQFALQLAGSLFKFSCAVTTRCGVDNAATIKKMLGIIVSPLYAVLQNGPVDDEVLVESDVRDALSAHMKDGRTALARVCIAMSTLEILVKEDFPSFISPVLDVFHVAVGLLCAVTPNLEVTDQSDALLPQYQSLSQSRRVIIAAIDLARTIFKDRCQGVLDGTDVYHLFRVFITLLNHPDTECTVILNALDTLPKLLPLGLDSSTLNEALAAQDSSLMEDLGFTVQKRLCSIESGIRDTTVECITKLLKTESDAVNEWVKANNLHKRLWESLVDSDSYVRSSILKALPVLSGCKELWEDMLRGANLSQIDTITTVTNIIKNDSEGFARRSAISCLTMWLQNEMWMKDSLQMHIQRRICKKQSVVKTGEESQAGCSQGKLKGHGQNNLAKSVSEDVDTDATADADNCDHNKCVDFTADVRAQQRLESERESKPTIGQVVLDAVAIATHDLDWEVKRGALQFWALVIKMYLPVYQDVEMAPGYTDRDDVPSRSREAEVGDDGDKVMDSDTMTDCSDEGANTGGMGSYKNSQLSDTVMDMLEETGCLKMLLRASLDEDSSVNQRACVMLHTLKKILHKICPEMQEKGMVNPTSEVAGDAADVLNEDVLNHYAFSDLIGHFFNQDWTVLLRQSCDGDIDGPVSLMTDILAAATDGEENLLDCY